MIEQDCKCSYKQAWIPHDLPSKEEPLQKQGGPGDINIKIYKTPFSKQKVKVAKLQYEEYEPGVTG